MIKKVVIAVLAIILIGGGIAWFNRQAIILYVVANRDRVEVAANRPIRWDAGPAEARIPARDRPPNIDRLAAEGMIFEQAYSGTASCAPSRAMLMTGRYPTRTGFEFTPTPDGMGRMVNLLADTDRSGLPPLEWDSARAEAAPPYAEQGLPGSEITIAEVLGEAGYHAVHIGKWHLGRGEEFNPNAQGFDESLLMASGLFLPEDHPDIVNARLDFDPIDQFLWARMQFAASFNGGEWFEPGGYLTDWWTDEAIGVIRANRNRPFFLYLAHWGVHTPLQAMRADYEAVSNIEPHRERVYGAMVRALDRSVGNIMDELETRGLADNTIIVFSSDNGGAGYVGLPDINAPYRGWKLTFFEGGIRVPLFIRWPARIAAGSRSDTPVAHIDLMPTLAAAGGAALPDGVTIDGIDLLPPSGAPERPGDAIFWQSGYYLVVRQGNWKLQVSERPEREWLFNLAEDPTEQTNLAQSHPEQVARMRALLDLHEEGRRPPLYPYTLEAPIAVDRTLADRVGSQNEVIYWPN